MQLEAQRDALADYIAKRPASGSEEMREETRELLGAQVKALQVRNWCNSCRSRRRGT